MSNDTTEFNIDSLLDGTLDDLADVPEFKPFPAGAHKVSVSLEYKVINKHPSYIVKMTAIETMELHDATKDEPLIAGAKADVAYMLDNEIGQGNFKRVMIAAANKFGKKSNRELVEDLKNVEAIVITKVRQNKDKTQSYTDITEIEIL